MRRVRPGWVVPGVLLYARNPIVALMGQAHKEPLMLLLALYVEAKRWPLTGGGLLMLSVLTKFLTVPLLLLYTAYMWQTPRLRRTLVVAALAGVAAVVIGLALSRNLSVLVRLVRVPGVGAGQPWPARMLLAGAAALAATAWGLRHSRTRRPCGPARRGSYGPRPPVAG